MKKLFAISLALLLALGLAAAPQAKAEKTLTVGLAKEPANLNPALISDLYGSAIACSIFDSLVSFTEDAANPSPALAESWTISADGKVYTFKLRKGVKFHNGQELTSADVKFTYENILDEKTGSPSKDFFSPVAKIETPDDYTVVITLKDPYGPFLLSIGDPVAGIVPAKALKEMGNDKFDRAPIGTGPYKFSEWVPDDHIVLAKNSDYFMADPKLDKVVFRPIPKPEVMAAELLSGGIDIGSDLLAQDIDRLVSEGLQASSAPGLSNHYVGFSYKTAPFSDVRFRKAVYHAVPIDQVVKGIYRSTATRAYTWIPDGVIPLDGEYMKSKALPFDEKKAAELFAELKKDGVLKDDFEFSIYCPQDAQRSKVATAVATQLKKHGINAKVETLEWGTLLPLLKEGKAGMYVMGWGSVPDPDRWTYKIFHPESAWNFSKYDVPAVTEALVKGRTTADNARRSELYKGAMRKALTEDYIHIPLVFKNSTVVMNPRVKGFKASPQKDVPLITDKRNVSVD